MKEDLENLCSWKLLANDPNSTTFQDVKKGNKLYDCKIKNGRPGCCPDYVNHAELIKRNGGYTNGEKNRN